MRRGLAASRGSHGWRAISSRGRGNQNRRGAPSPSSEIGASPDLRQSGRAQRPVLAATMSQLRMEGSGMARRLTCRAPARMSDAVVFLRQDLFGGADHAGVQVLLAIAAEP